MAAKTSSKIQTFVIFDLEATGLPHFSTDYPVRIMEISMVAVQRPGKNYGPGVGNGEPGAQAAAAAAAVPSLPPEQRGMATPKRPIRKPNEREAAPGRGRPRPRLADEATPPDEEPAPEPLFSPLPALPRVRNCLLLAVNPGKQIPATVSEITDLDNDLLEHHAGFDAALADLLHTYLTRLPAPVCLVAHNGARYDFPLLKAELRHAGATWINSSEIVCADSLAFFRWAQKAEAAAEREQQRAADAPLDSSVYSLNPSTLSCGHGDPEDNCIVCNPGMFLDYDECDSNVDYEVTRVAGRRAVRCLHVAGRTCVVCVHVPQYRGGGGGGAAPAARRQLFSGAKSAAPKRSLKLPDVYRARFGLPPERSHCAGDDVDALLALCLSHGERFCAWVDENCTPLRDVKEMWVRRPSGAQRTA